MVQIQFSLMKKIKIGRPEHLLTPSPYVRQHLIFVKHPTHFKVGVTCVSLLTHGVKVGPGPWDSGPPQTLKA